MRGHTSEKRKSPSPSLSYAQLPLSPGDQLPPGVINLDLYGAAAIQAVGGAAQSRVVGPHRHLHLIQALLGDHALLDDLVRHLPDAHVHGGHVVGGAHNDVGPADEAVGVGGIIMDQGAPEPIS